MSGDTEPGGETAVGVSRGASGARVRLRVSVGAGIGLVLIAAIAAILTSVFAGQGVTELVGASSSVAGESGSGSTSGNGTSDNENAGRGNDGAGTDGKGSGPGGAPGADGAAEGLSGFEVDPSSRTAVFVHVLGEIAHPGLYQLTDGARVIDVIAAAGGLTAEAAPGGVNLARYVSDGEQLYVPAVGEEPPPGWGNTSGSSTGSSSDRGPGQGTGKVNINTASQAELESLPQVGPALATRIMEWRSSFGRFNSIEDLMSVTGIGEKTFAGLRDLVTT